MMARRFATLTKASLIIRAASHFILPSLGHTETIGDKLIYTRSFLATSWAQLHGRDMNQFLVTPNCLAVAWTPFFDYVSVQPDFQTQGIEAIFRARSDVQNDRRQWFHTSIDAAKAHSRDIRQRFGQLKLASASSNSGGKLLSINGC